MLTPPASPNFLAASALADHFHQSLRPGQLLVELFDAVPGAYFFAKDRDGRFMTCSPSFARMLGAAGPEALLGKTDYDLTPDFLADVFVADDRRVIGEGISIINKVELAPSPDGSLDWLCTTKTPLFGRDGSIVGLAGILRIIRDSEALYAEHPEMRRIVNFVRIHYREKLSVAAMAREGGISVSSQERLFRRTFGLTPLMYLRRTRLNAACRMLRESNTELAEIARQCGFNDQTSMTRAFRIELKITPYRYRRRFSDLPLKRGETGFEGVLRKAG